MKFDPATQHSPNIRKTERELWLEEREKEFVRLCQTEPCVRPAIAATRNGELTMEMALKVACLQLAEIKNKYREHVNISELNRTVSFIIPPVVARQPKPGEVEQSIDAGAERERQKLVAVVTPPLNPEWDMQQHEDLLQQSIEIIRETQRVSCSVLQRRLKIGYTRASEILDELERRGIVGQVKPFGEPRDILKLPAAPMTMGCHNGDLSRGATSGSQINVSPTLAPLARRNG